MKKNNKLFELIFDAPYEKHNNKFWQVFWKRKAIEVGKVLMWIVISIVAYFVLLYFPSSLFMGDRAVKIKINADVDSGKTRLVSSNYIHAYKFENVKYPEFKDSAVNNDFNNDFNVQVDSVISGHGYGDPSYTNGYGDPSYTNRSNINGIIEDIFNNWQTTIFFRNDETKSIDAYEKTYKDAKHKWIYKDITTKPFSIVNRVPIMKKQLILIVNPNISDDQKDATAWAWFGYHCLVILIYSGLFLIILAIRYWLSSNYKKMMNGRRD